MVRADTEGNGHRRMPQERKSWFPFANSRIGVPFPHSRKMWPFYTNHLIIACPNYVHTVHISDCVTWKCQGTLTAHNLVSYT